MSMIRNAVFAALLLTSGATQALAASEADFKAAYEAAKTAENHAAALHNRWTTTEAALAAAKTAAAAGDFDAAIRRRQGRRGAGKGVDLPGDQREGTLEGRGNSLENVEKRHRYEGPTARFS